MTQRQRKLSVLSSLLVSAIFMAACGGDEFYYGTWTKKLDDANEVERAVTQLERLGDNRAIPSLG